METKDFIEDLGISVEDNDFEVMNNTYTLYLKDSDEFADLYSMLSKNDLLELDTNDTSMDENNSKFVYVKDDYKVTLDADYDSDVYELIVERE